VATEFLRGYFEAAGSGGFLPANDTELAALLDLCLLDKALYEVTYELNQRPDWIHIPLRGISNLLTESVPSA
jgi:maltose alpha-D-glucosyltransferase/alpha-amylase